jgi:hypothetical protein
LCWDAEDWLLLTRRCEIVTVVVGETGTLTIEAHASDAGGVLPMLFFATSGRYTTTQTQGSGTVSVGIEAGQRYTLFVGIPTGTTGRYNLSTSVR